MEKNERAKINLHSSCYFLRYVGIFVLGSIVATILTFFSIKFAKSDFLSNFLRFLSKNGLVILKNLFLTITVIISFIILGICAATEDWDFDEKKNAKIYIFCYSLIVALYGAILIVSGELAYYYVRLFTSSHAWAVVSLVFVIIFDLMCMFFVYMARKNGYKEFYKNKYGKILDELYLKGRVLYIYDTHKKDGDFVKKGDCVAVIKDENRLVPIEAKAEGYVHYLPNVHFDKNIPTNHVIGYIQQN